MKPTSAFADKSPRLHSFACRSLRIVFLNVTLKLLYTGKRWLLFARYYRKSIALGKHSPFCGKDRRFICLTILICFRTDQGTVRHRNESCAMVHPPVSLWVTRICRPKNKPLVSSLKTQLQRLRALLTLQIAVFKRPCDYYRQGREWSRLRWLKTNFWECHRSRYEGVCLENLCSRPT